MTENPIPTPPPEPAHPGHLPPGAHVRHRRRRTRPVVAAGLAAGTLAASAAITHAVWPASVATTATSAFTPSPSTSPSTGNGSNSAGSGTANVSSIASKVDPALVDIVTTFGYQQAEGAGTGIVLTSTGEILTNNHVINGATSISVTDIGTGQTYRANVVGYDATRDLAVLQLVGASGLATASTGDSGAVKVGQEVVAIGNAGGTGGTPTAAGGTVTALNQAITASDQLNGTSENLSNLIETNADIQSGDSGGALVDSAGRVIGVNSAAASGLTLQSAGSSNQGYAIPIDEALSVAKQIEAGRASSTVHVGSTPFLGVLLSSSSSQFPGFGSSADGAAVSGVVSGGPASAAGLVAGDVITSVSGTPVTSAGTLSQVISADRAGQAIQITWTDQAGSSHSATVTLQAGPPA